MMSARIKLITRLGVASALRPIVHQTSYAKPSRIRDVSKRWLSTAAKEERSAAAASAKAGEALSRQGSFVGPADQHLAKHLLDRITELDRRLNYQGWHTLRWTSLLLAVATTAFWLFRENVSSGVGDAASEVTRRTLENEDVQHQASELARGVVYELLNDKRALDLTAEFLNEVIQRETTKKAVVTLVMDVLGRPETEIALRGLVSNVLTHQESAEKAVTFLQHIVAIPESRDALVTVLSGVFNQPATQAITSDFFKGVMQTENFVNATNKLGADTVQYLLSNEELKTTAVIWCNAVLNDPRLQSTAGDAVWAAVKGAFVPWGKPKPLSVAQSPVSTTAQPPAPSVASTSPGPSPVPARPTVLIAEHPVDVTALLTPPSDSEAAPAAALSTVPILVIEPTASTTLNNIPSGKVDDIISHLTEGRANEVPAA